MGLSQDVAKALTEERETAPPPDDVFNAVLEINLTEVRHYPPEEQKTAVIAQCEQLCHAILSRLGLETEPAASA